MAKSTRIFVKLTIPLKPGEYIEMPRHTPESMYHIVSGSGYSTIDRYGIDSEAGDLFSCPSYSYHEHWNTEEENVIMLTIGIVSIG